MDKPLLISQIQNNIDVSLEYIQDLAKKELDRQIQELVVGMLYKKEQSLLKEIIGYKGEVYAISEGIKSEIKESNKQEYSNRSKGGKTR